MNEGTNGKADEIRAILNALERCPVALYTPLEQDGFGPSMKFRLVPNELVEKVWGFCIQ